MKRGAWGCNLRAYPLSYVCKPLCYLVSWWLKKKKTEARSTIGNGTWGTGVRQPHFYFIPMLVGFFPFVFSPRTRTKRKTAILVLPHKRPICSNWQPNVNRIIWQVKSCVRGALLPAFRLLCWPTRAFVHLATVTVYEHENMTSKHGPAHSLLYYLCAPLTQMSTSQQASKYIGSNCFCSLIGWLNLKEKETRDS